MELRDGVRGRGTSIPALTLPSPDGIYPKHAVLFGFPETIKLPASFYREGTRQGEQLYGRAGGTEYHVGDQPAQRLDSILES